MNATDDLHFKRKPHLQLWKGWNHLLLWEVWQRPALDVPTICATSLLDLHRLVRSSVREKMESKAKSFFLNKNLNVSQPLLGGHHRDPVQLIC